jgi:hypothetical protein
MHTISAVRAITYSAMARSRDHTVPTIFTVLEFPPLTMHPPSDTCKVIKTQAWLYVFPSPATHRGCVLMLLQFVQSSDRAFPAVTLSRRQARRGTMLTRRINLQDFCTLYPLYYRSKCNIKCMSFRLLFHLQSGGVRCYRCEIIWRRSMHNKKCAVT